MRCEILAGAEPVLAIMFMFNLTYEWLSYLGDHILDWAELHSCASGAGHRTLRTEKLSSQN